MAQSVASTAACARARTFFIGIGPDRNVGAEAFGIFQSTGVAFRITGVVTADTIHAEITHALIVSRAGIAQGLLVDTCVATAPVIGFAIGVCIARIVAIPDTVTEVVSTSRFGICTCIVWVASTFSACQIALGTDGCTGGGTANTIDTESTLTFVATTTGHADCFLELTYWSVAPVCRYTAIVVVAGCGACRRAALIRGAR